jgi:hypothetical protein
MTSSGGLVARGNRKRCRAFYSAGGRPASVRMKDELTTILEAVGAAQAELAAYLTSGDRNAELTIAKLIGILDRRDVVKAARLLRLSHGATAVPKAALAKAS